MAFSRVRMVKAQQRKPGQMTFSGPPEHYAVGRGLQRVPKKVREEWRAHRLNLASLVRNIRAMEKGRAGGQHVYAPGVKHSPVKIMRKAGDQARVLGVSPNGAVQMGKPDLHATDYVGVFTPRAPRKPRPPPRAVPEAPDHTFLADPYRELKVRLVHIIVSERVFKEDDLVALLERTKVQAREICEELGLDYWRCERVIYELAHELDIPQEADEPPAHTALPLAPPADDVPIPTA
jgi:hypothetical protein